MFLALFATILPTSTLVGVHALCPGQGFCVGLDNITIDGTRKSYGVNMSHFATAQQLSAVDAAHDRLHVLAADKTFTPTLLGFELSTGKLASSVPVPDIKIPPGGFFGVGMDMAYDAKSDTVILSGRNTLEQHGFYSFSRSAGTVKKLNFTIEELLGPKIVGAGIVDIIDSGHTAFDGDSILWMVVATNRTYGLIDVLVGIDPYKGALSARFDYPSSSCTHPGAFVFDAATKKLSGVTRVESVHGSWAVTSIDTKTGKCTTNGGIKGTAGFEGGMLAFNPRRRTVTGFWSSYEGGEYKVLEVAIENATIVSQSPKAVCSLGPPSKLPECPLSLWWW